MFDGWIDIKNNLTKKEAELLYNEKTENGTEMTSYNDGDYLEQLSDEEYEGERTAVCQCTDCTGTYHDVLDGKRKCEVCKMPLLAD